MINPNVITAPKSASNSDCPDADAATTFLVLDAPAAKTGEPTPSASGLPKNFRSMTDPWHTPGKGTPPSTVGLDTLNASGSAQFCKGQLQAIQALLAKMDPVPPLTIVDLRQESHGFFDISQPLQGESTIAVGWFVERDWINIGRDLVGIVSDENWRLYSSLSQPNFDVNEIKSENKEGGVCTVQKYPVQMTNWAAEDQLAPKLGCGYQRFPTTDHVRPRDSEVDQFVAFETTLTKGTWLHFHCRGGDGRTTTFLAMHDIFHNIMTPGVTIDDILIRQQWLGGIDLDQPPDATSTSWKYPFAFERAQFIRNFATYVQKAQPGGSQLTWSTWVANQTVG